MTFKRSLALLATLLFAALADCPVCPPNKLCPKFACRIICEGVNCASDSDCHLQSNYCSGCNCEALTANQPGTACGANQRCSVSRTGASPRSQSPVQYGT